jgi:DNA-binding CsgD family transcriptional regulator
VQLPSGVTLEAEFHLSDAGTGPRVAIVRLNFVGLHAGHRNAATRVGARHGLTATESRVLHFVALGLGNAAIAARCGVSVETVRTHVKHVLGKLGVKARAQAALAVWTEEQEED